MQHALVSLFEQVREGLLTVEKIVQKTSHAPATLFQVADRGFIREGYYADLAIIKPNNAGSHEQILSKCGWSPFTGHNFSHQVTHTWVNGNLAFQNNTIHDVPKGRALSFART